MKKIDEAKGFISRDREEVIDKLVDFFSTDLLIFWGTEKDLVLRQEKHWKPIILWLENLLTIKLNHSSGLDVPEQAPETTKKIRALIGGLSDLQLSVYYATSLILRSTILAMAFVKKRIDAKEAFEASFIEELFQAENWGNIYEAEERRNSILAELLVFENFLDDDNE